MSTVLKLTTSSRSITVKLIALWLASASSLFCFEYGLKLEKIKDGIYCYFGKPEVIDSLNNGNMVNSCFVDMGKSWLVIDSGPTYLYAKEAYKNIEKIKDLPVSYVINTHMHDDHWLGNGFYKEHGATILGSRKAFDEIGADSPTRMQNRISKEAYASTKIVLPQMYIEKHKRLIIDEQEVIIRVLNHRAHTKSDLYVYIPSKKALFAGDLIFNDRLPSLRDGGINGWIFILEEIEDMDLDVIIGGHGRLIDISSPRFTLNYLKRMRDGVKKVIDEGGDISEAVESLIMREYMKSALYDDIHKANINAVFQMMEWSDE